MRMPCSSTRAELSDAIPKSDTSRAANAVISRRPANGLSSGMAGPYNAERAERLLIGYFSGSPTTPHQHLLPPRKKCCPTKTSSAADELDDRVGERVVVVAGGGVARVGEFDELGGGHLVEEVLHAVDADHIGKLAADQQDRDPQVDRRALQLFHAQLRVVLRFGHQLRIPMPVPPAVAVAQILLEALRTARPRPMRQVGGHGLGGV